MICWHHDTELRTSHWHRISIKPWPLTARSQSPSPISCISPLVAPIWQKIMYHREVGVMISLPVIQFSIFARLYLVSPSFLSLWSSIVKSILTWDEEEINTSNFFLPRSSLILPASSQQLCRENWTKTRWKMQARDQKLARVWKCWELPLKVVTDFLGLTGFQ